MSRWRSMLEKRLSRAPLAFLRWRRRFENTATSTGYEMDDCDVLSLTVDCSSGSGSVVASCFCSDS
jgi:hypothetical protein